MRRPDLLTIIGHFIAAGPIVALWAVGTARVQWCCIDSIVGPPWVVGLGGIEAGNRLAAICVITGIVGCAVGLLARRWILSVEGAWAIMAAPLLEWLWSHRLS